MVKYFCDRCGKEMKDGERWNEYIIPIIYEKYILCEECCIAMNVLYSAFKADARSKIEEIMKKGLQEQYLALDMAVSIDIANGIVRDFSSKGALQKYAKSMLEG